MLKNNEPISYTTKRSSRAKNMRLTVKDDGQVFLTLPRLVPEFMGKIFVQKNVHWINKKRLLLQKNNLAISSAYTDDFQSGQTLTLFDQKKYSIKIEKSSRKQNYYKAEEGILALFLNHNTKANRRRLVQQFYQDQAREYLSGRSAYFADKLGLTFNQIRIKNTKTRWGSCSSKKNLNYNWRIMLAPIEVVDYLVVHEVCHLKEMSHSSRFWNLVQRLDPQFKSHKKWLKENQGPLLNFLVN